MSSREGSSQPAHSGPGRPRDERVHEAILEATRELIRERGYRDVSIEAIARRAHVAKSTIYRWWRSKGMLVFEAVWSAARWREMPDTGDLEQDLREMLRIAVDNWNDLVVRRGFPGMLADLANDRQLYEVVDEKFLDRDRQAKARVFERAIERGVMEAVSTDLLWDVTTGYLLIRLIQSPDPLTQQQTDDLVDVILGGIVKRSC